MFVHGTHKAGIVYYRPNLCQLATELDTLLDGVEASSG
jgi:hypothetical protein